MQVSSLKRARSMDSIENVDDELGSRILGCIVVASISIVRR